MAWKPLETMPHRRERCLATDPKTWSDEIIQVPNGDACLSAEGEKCSPSLPHNERARGVRHEEVGSLVPACSGATICNEQGREDPTGHADRSINSAEMVERFPLITRRLVTRMQLRLHESEVADVRHVTAERRLA